MSVTVLEKEFYVVCHSGCIGQGNYACFGSNSKQECISKIHELRKGLSKVDKLYYHTTYTTVTKAQLVQYINRGWVRL